MKDQLPNMMKKMTVPVAKGPTAMMNQQMAPQMSAIRARLNSLKTVKNC